MLNKMPSQIVQLSIPEVALAAGAYMVGWVLSVPVYLVMLPVFLRTNEDSARLADTMEEAIDYLFPDIPPKVGDSG